MRLLHPISAYGKNRHQLPVNGCMWMERDITKKAAEFYIEDGCPGTITSIIVPGSNKLLSMFSANNDIVIEWQNIKCIGNDVILVEI